MRSSSRGTRRRTEPARRVILLFPLFRCELLHACGVNRYHFFLPLRCSDSRGPRPVQHPTPSFSFPSCIGPMAARSRNTTPHACPLLAFQVFQRSSLPLSLSLHTAVRVLCLPACLSLSLSPSLFRLCLRLPLSAFSLPFARFRATRCPCRWTFPCRSRAPTSWSSSPTSTPTPRGGRRIPPPWAPGGGGGTAAGAPCTARAAGGP